MLIVHAMNKMQEQSEPVALRPRETWTTWPGIRRTVTGLTATAILVSGCSGWEADDDSRSSLPLTAAEVETNARVHLPPGTVMLSTSYAHFTDWHLTASFRIPSATLREFLREGRFGEPTPGLRAVTKMDNPSDDTWRPDAATNVSGVDQTADEKNIEGVYRKLLLDQRRAGEVTVYLVAFTT